MYTETPLTASEQKAVDSLIDNLGKKMLAEGAAPNIKRDAHPKQIGLVRAEFIVESNLADHLKVGVFKDPATYPAWIRFSHESSTNKRDDDKDARGVAIKLVGVPGKKILEDEADAVTQDFVMVTTDIFVTKGVEEFAQLVASVMKGKYWVLAYLLTHPRSFKNLSSSRKVIGSILDERFWSVAPYRYGDAIVKYSIQPQSDAKTPLQPDRGPRFLTDVLQQQLDKSEYYYDFMVQFQRDPKTMPTDDLRVRWSPDEAPFHKVATLKIPRQSFNTREQEDYGDQLSFTPWHSLPEHTPVGNINLARKQVYAALSRFRHEKNGIARFEPTDMSVPAAPSLQSS
ncbi:hypothetical protein DB346_08080 [Verrucomicrobia bacterium LW23]|nr:hypothetical protein DB346_08080 [Verrucomicrobia bacterium LW23]